VSSASIPEVEFFGRNMNVSELMTRSVRTCAPQDDLAAAGSAMWEADCGIVPIVDDARRVVGVITDRDICIALSTRGAPASQIRVQDVMSRKVAACAVDDEIEEALGAMASRQVRRLPVLDTDGALQGVLSLNDVVLRAAPARSRRGAGPTYDQVAETLKAICRHPSTRKPAAESPAAAKVLSTR
jgi:CBS-domain-containing membrane protein